LAEDWARGWDWMNPTLVLWSATELGFGSAAPSAVAWAALSAKGLVVLSEEVSAELLGEGLAEAWAAL